ncbi:MAG: MBL fold metallo-hydrolase [Epsilonproteobacteria bacterium]|nr:MBL fold metallo-hydrolase [Campylobacterota bacterium]NPA57094.1 MBL fold metallo-hydrolase [Campylobacterota bacterium]
MQIESRPMGSYATNCYIVSIDDKEFVIDPGIGATPWVLERVRNPVAILNTHGHFDHVWSNRELQKELGVPIVIHEADTFLIEGEQFALELPPSRADITIKGNRGSQQIELGGIPITFHHFPGHTPGSCVIEIGENWFSGDFIFRGSIGRVDFPYSDPRAMAESLIRFKEIDYDRPLYPGHGEPTTISREQRTVESWIDYLRR